MVASEKCLHHNPRQMDTNARQEGEGIYAMALLSGIKIMAMSQLIVEPNRQNNYFVKNHAVEILQLFSMPSIHKGCTITTI